MPGGDSCSQVCEASRAATALIGEARLVIVEIVIVVDGAARVMEAVLEASHEVMEAAGKVVEILMAGCGTIVVVEQVEQGS